MSQKIDWETLDLVQHQIVSAVATQQADQRLLVSTRETRRCSPLLVRRSIRFTFHGW